MATPPQTVTGVTKHHIGDGTGGRPSGGRAELRHPSPGLHWGRSLTAGWWGLINTPFFSRSCEPLRWKAQCKHRPETFRLLGDFSAAGCGVCVSACAHTHACPCICGYPFSDPLICSEPLAHWVLVQFKYYSNIVFFLSSIRPHRQ